MAKYSDIKGFTVQTVSSDPAASVASTGSWSSGGSLNTGRGYAAAEGDIPASIYISGYSATGAVAIVESYNGSSWTEVADVNSAKAAAASAGSYLIKDPYLGKAVNIPLALREIASYNDVDEMLRRATERREGIESMLESIPSRFKETINEAKGVKDETEEFVP